VYNLIENLNDAFYIKVTGPRPSYNFTYTLNDTLLQNVSGFTITFTPYCTLYNVEKISLVFRY